MVLVLDVADDWSPHPSLGPDKCFSRQQLMTMNSKH